MHSTLSDSDYVVVECEPDWLTLVERAGELAAGEQEVRGPRRVRALKACGQYDPEFPELDDCTVSVVERIDPRHSAIRPGDLLVARFSGGVYSVVDGVWFVRLAD